MKIFNAIIFFIAIFAFYVPTLSAQSTPDPQTTGSASNTFGTAKGVDTSQRPIVGDTNQNSYSPLAVRGKKIIETVTYTASPIVLPFNAASPEIQPNGAFFDFKQRINEPFEVVNKFFKDSHATVTPMNIFNQNVKFFRGQQEAFVFGFKEGSNESNYVVKPKSWPYMVSITIKRDGQNTIMTIPGVISAQVYGPGTPSRASFKPADAKKIPFRWN